LAEVVAFQECIPLYCHVYDWGISVILLSFDKKLGIFLDFFSFPNPNLANFSSFLKIFFQILDITIFYKKTWWGCGNN